MRISAKLHTEDERLYADFQATVQVGGGLSLGHALMWDKQELLTQEMVELLTSPLELAEYKTAIMEAMFKGTKRNVESENDPKNAQVG